MDAIVVARKAIVYIEKWKDYRLNLRKYLYFDGGRREELQKQSEESPGRDKTAW